MDVRIDAARGKDASFSREYLCRGANFHAGRHAVHDAGITGLADRSNPPIADRNISLVDSRIVEDQRVVITRSGAPPARVASGDWPMPSRITLPPPNLTSSP